MNLPSLAIKRPIFITCIFLLLLILGVLSMRRMAVDLFPDVTFPYVTVITTYPGASPSDVETQVSKPLEDEISSVSGLKSLSSSNKENVSIVFAEFNLDVDIKDAEQQVRNSVALVRNKLPTDVEEPVIRRIDAAATPITMIAVTADMPQSELYDLVDQVVKPRLQQVDQLGLIEILGGRKREIQVSLDLDKLRDYKISASQVAEQIALAGQNIPIGKVDIEKQEKVFRLMGEFQSLDKIRDTIIMFVGNDQPVRVGDVAKIVDTLEDEKSRTFVDGNSALVLSLYKQSKSNTIRVVDGVDQKLKELKTELSKTHKGFGVRMVWDGGERIRLNVSDVQQSILLGIFLTIIVVLFFLGNVRSTLITGIAIPNSLLGAFILMLIAGFSYNIMSLMALSLSVGLLIDDAIVVRENIFRHIENGEPPFEAAHKGTNEVMLAVIATTCAVLAVFGPVGFLKGVIGQFFKEFGLTICFAMVISLFDSLTMAPMLSAYFAGISKTASQHKSFLTRGIDSILGKFTRFQDLLEVFYEKSLRVVLNHHRKTLLAGLVIFLLSVSTVIFIPKTFMAEHEMGEFTVTMEMAPGTNLNEMSRVGTEIDNIVKSNPEVSSTVLTIGNTDGESNLATIYVHLVPKGQRKLYTSAIKERLRGQLKSYAALAAPKVTDLDIMGGNMRPFNLEIQGNNLGELEQFTNKVYERLKANPALQDPEISNKAGKPEVQVAINEGNLARYGLSTTLVGSEVRTLIQGTVPAVFRENCLEYDVRVRLAEESRNLEKTFNKILVPNVNHTMIPLSQVATMVEKKGPVTINRSDRNRYINIAGDIASKSKGIGGLMNDIKKMFETDLPLPKGITYKFVGEAENYTDMMTDLVFAMILGVFFIYFVLASLYESFVTPLAIMLVLPLAMCGGFLALFITHQSLSLFSMIGCVLLLGVATKNSILLVDLTLQLMKQGMSRFDALILAGKTRLRPILMTSFALIAGMLPNAIGINEVALMRRSMGIVVIGGVISSTLLSLIIVPAAFAYVDKLNIWVMGKFRKRDT